MLISLGLWFWGVSAQPAFQAFFIPAFQCGADLNAVTPALHLVLCAIVHQCWVQYSPSWDGQEPFHRLHQALGVQGS